MHCSSPAQSGEPQCSVAGPVGARHPVQGLLERFKAGPGCAARERGNKETHVIALRRVTNSPENKVANNYLAKTEDPGFSNRGAFI